MAQSKPNTPQGQGKRPLIEVSGGTMRDVIAIGETSKVEVHVHGDGEAQEDETFLAAYLKHVAKQCNVVWCPGLEADGEAPRIELLRVYASLATREPRDPEEHPEAGEADHDQAGGASQGVERVPILRSVMDHRRLAILGEAGGGKSTVLRWLGRSLALSALQPDGEDGKRLKAEGGDDLQGQIPFWVELKTLNLPAPPQKKPGPPKCPDPPSDDWLWKEMLRQVAGACGDVWAGLKPVLAKLAADGRAMFLLDGLDEVTDPHQLEFLQQALGQFVVGERGSNNRVLLTCREATWYRGWRLPRWEPRHGAEVRTLLPFDQDDRRTFLEQWFSEQAQLIEARPAKAEALQANQAEARRLRSLPETLIGELHDSVRNRNGRLVSLVSVPLNLTMVAWLRSRPGGGENKDAPAPLPASRAAIFEQTIHAILWEIDEHKQLKKPEDRTLGQLVGEELSDRQRFCGILAGMAHRSLRTAPTGPAPSIPTNELLRELGRFCDPGSPDRHRDWSVQVLATIQCRAGLLKEADGGSYKFAHRSFQEFLAAAHLVHGGKFVEAVSSWLKAAPLNPAAADPKAADQARERLWEPLRLACGYLAVPADQQGRLLPGTVRDRDTALGLLWHLVREDAGWTEVWLAGELWQELDLPEEPDGAWAGLKRRLQERLRELIEAGALTPYERAAAGRALGWLGDPRPGVGVMPAAGLRGGLPDLRWDTDAWAQEIPPGKFLMGCTEAEAKDDDEQPQFTCTQIKAPFRLSRHLITVKQYACFVADGGYDPERDHWTAAARDWLREKKITGPADGDQPAFQTPNHPRVGVSWHEAQAFCTWLHGHREKLGVPPGWEIRLPTEAEWERAARNAEGRLFPWLPPKRKLQEADWPAELTAHCNWHGTGLGHTSAVGLFPSGAAACGALDMTGNVWESCRTKWRGNYADYDAQADQSPEGTERRVLRGGSWYSDADLCRAANRNRSSPGYRTDLVGFRVVASPCPLNSEPSGL
jgi:formylglycine-generating enzyme required for sulfatase activity